MFRELLLHVNKPSINLITKNSDLIIVITEAVEIFLSSRLRFRFFCGTNVDQKQKSRCGSV